MPMLSTVQVAEARPAPTTVDPDVIACPPRGCHEIDPPGGPPAKEAKDSDVIPCPPHGCHEIDPPGGPPANMEYLVLYCSVDRSMRMDFWLELALVIEVGYKACSYIGDLNDIIEQDEKLGGKNITSKSYFFIRNSMNDNEAIDLGFIGNIFKWWQSKH
ncbi:hypothetical protein FEM48_Zijuj10G0107200 [Ziziphus jujuba var. spinosa]|uniref:Uncharacterized protein n=1 Tax=Ziziphus jujuba var. spinosa TaxID=714518 RepID=A0A978UMW9_ZIZJJ|nr:hypothetical protein FEM48_Zijuj10G0107200 [Ziziphus jujuba var. spinosa]